MTYLEAINYILAMTGSPEVQEEDLAENYPDIVGAKARLDTEIRTIQNRGWWFNTLTANVTPDPDSNLVSTSGILRLLPRHAGTFTLRNDNLYNLTDGTFEFLGEVSLSAVVQLAWEDLPFSVQEFAKQKAAEKVILMDLEDFNKAQMLGSAIMEAQVALFTEEGEARKVNALCSPAALRALSGTKPYRLQSINNNLYPLG